jgi:hypothetical protein
MNWRVGLFRIWVLFAALWIAACAAYGFVEWKNSTAKYEVTDPSGTKFIVRAPGGVAESDIWAFVRDHHVAKQRMADCEKNHGPWCDAAMDLEMPID